MVEAAAAARKPMKRKRAKKRRDSRPRCDRNRCTKPARVVVPPLFDGPMAEGGFIPDEAILPMLALCPTHAKREADRLCRLIVLDRDSYTCQRCGATEAIQWAHILTRSELSLRWLPENSLALCAKCHVYMTHRPVEWMDWVDDHYREDRIGQLRIWRLDAVSRGDKPDYSEIIASLRSQAAGKER